MTTIMPFRQMLFLLIAIARQAYQKWKLPTSAKTHSFSLEERKMTNQVLLIIHIFFRTKPNIRVLNRGLVLPPAYVPYLTSMPIP